jgi:nicotinate-nucleotide--dimethylbenzimidazole phosphoribosyltransferase
VERAVGRAAGISDPVGLLAEIGGLELAAMAGFYVEAAARAVPIVLDGVISLASVLVADQMQPGTAERCIAGHRSTEPGASVALAHLAAVPLLELDLRLGEGTGAVLAIPLVQAAARVLNDMADLPG